MQIEEKKKKNSEILLFYSGYSVTIFRKTFEVFLITVVLWQILCH